MKSLDGKRSLIVGVGSGIGRGVFDAYVAAGAHVGALEIDEPKCADLAAASDGPVINGDATSRDDNEAAVAATVDAYGGLDIVVNCVGLFDFYLGLGDIDPDVFDDAFVEAMNVNVRSHLLSVRASVDHLRASRGSVVLTCSTSSFTPGRGGVLYVASKFALRGCVTALAHELLPTSESTAWHRAARWAPTCAGCAHSGNRIDHSARHRTAPMTSRPGVRSGWRSTVTITPTAMSSSVLLPHAG